MLELYIAFWSGEQTAVVWPTIGLHVLLATLAVCGQAISQQWQLDFCGHRNHPGVCEIMSSLYAATNCAMSAAGICKNFDVQSAQSTSRICCAARRGSVRFYGRMKYKTKLIYPLLSACPCVGAAHRCNSFRCRFHGRLGIGHRVQMADRTCTVHSDCQFSMLLAMIEIMVVVWFV